MQEIPSPVIVVVKGDRSVTRKCKMMQGAKGRRTRRFKASPVVPKASDTYPIDEETQASEASSEQYSMDVFPDLSSLITNDALQS
jgi:hypothetical protein